MALKQMTAVRNALIFWHVPEIRCHMAVSYLWWLAKWPFFLVLVPVGLLGICFEKTGEVIRAGVGDIGHHTFGRCERAKAAIIDEAREMVSVEEILSRTGLPPRVRA